MKFLINLYITKTTEFMDITETCISGEDLKTDLAYPLSQKQLDVENPLSSITEIADHSVLLKITLLVK